MIAVPITAETWSEALAAVADTSGHADLVELRLDYIRDRSLTVDGEELLRAAVAASTCPLIFTHRSGKPEPAPNRTAQNVSRLMSGREQLARDYFDFDLRADNSTGLHLYNTYVRLFGAHPRIILSHHDFTACNETELMAVYERMTVFSPDVIKIAAQAARLSDQLAIFSLLAAARADKRAIIALAMGEAGRVSRLLAPAYGGFLTFASLAVGAESAPGQFTLDEMLSLYRVPSLTERTAVFALIGNPVGHSVSPHMHNAAFTALGIDAVYLPIKAEGEELQEFTEKLIHPRTRVMGWPFRGASVTVPHKIAIMPLMDEIDETALLAGAVNTIVVDGEKLRGHNTDIYGAMAPLEKLIELKNARVAVLGAGGAARGVVAGLHARGAQVTVYCRDINRADGFNDVRPLSEASRASCDILINTTPVGMKGWGDAAAMPIETLPRCAVVYDLIYNPQETALLRAARERGLRTLGGLDMLIAQAGEQFRLWTGQSPPIEIMRAAALKRLEK